MSAHRDPELDHLGDEQRWDDEVRELAQYMRATPHPYGHVEPSTQFRQNLRRRLMREAWEQASRPPLPWYRRLLAPQGLAMAGAAVGAVLIVSVAFLLTLGPHETDQINVQVVSPQQNAELLPTVQPIVLTFSKPMKTDSVLVRVDPAIARGPDQWDPQHKTLTITPVNGLSPNTQYKVTVVSATTAQSQPVAPIKPVTFSTAPTPAPTPSTGPTPTPAPTPILGTRQVAPVGNGRFHWSLDGGSLIVIGPNGALQQFPVAGGAPQKLADGVSLAAVAPDGSVAWLSNGSVTWKSTTVGNVQPIAIGFRGTTLLLASATDVERSDQTSVATFKETADAAEFAVNGSRLAYHGPSGLHLVDLATGRDTLVGPATGLGAWAPDGHHYAYATDAGVSVADASDGSTARLADLPGVTGITWSGGNQFLFATANTLSLANYPTDGSLAIVHKLATLQDGYGQPDWAPTGSGQFAFRRAGEAWVARVANATPGASITPVTPGVSQDDLVNSFMKARQNLLSAQALSFLDPAGRDAFASLNLIYPDASLNRYSVLLSQPGRVVVRLVLVHGTLQTAVDETLVIQPDAGGHQFIHAVTETPRTGYATGPEVLSVTVTSGGQVQVVFDSDLNAGTVTAPGAVGIKGVNTQATYDSRQKMVTLTAPGGLTAGATYNLTISNTLQDVNQRHAVAYDLQFNGI